MQPKVRHHIGVPPQLLPVHTSAAGCGDWHSGRKIHSGANPENHGRQGTAPKENTQKVSAFWQSFRELPTAAALSLCLMLDNDLCKFCCLVTFA